MRELHPGWDPERLDPPEYDDYQEDEDAPPYEPDQEDY